MRKLLWVVFSLFFVNLIHAQELKATVVVNGERMTDVNQQIFKNLEKKVTEFLNTTRFTEKKFSLDEKIDCNFFINVSKYSNNIISATLQIQSSRTIYNSAYASTVLNINDKKFDFNFVEFEQLVYDQNSFTSNLVSVLSFYANVIIGTDADSFSELSGTEHFKVASNIMNLAQPSGYTGWSQSESNNNNRYFLITDILSSTYTPYRKTIYQYHLQGLDLMADDLLKGKTGIANAIETLSSIQRSTPNALLTRTFFDAKSDEIVSIFSGGPIFDNKNTIELLNRISPLNSALWNKIR